MRKLTALLLLAGLVLGLFSGCSQAVTESTAVQESLAAGKKVAFLSGAGGIKDHSFNEFSYKGVVDFAKEYSLSCFFIEPEDTSQETLEAAIQQAVEEGAGIIILAGSLYAKPCLHATVQNPTTLFLGLAFTPKEMGTAQAPNNVAMLLHRDEQAGFLAGYAAVADGYRELGFLGGMDVPAVVRYGHGFIQGADRAAAALGAEDVHVKYCYTGTFSADPQVEELAAGWYREGTEVIFSCGGGIYESVLAAAEAEDGLMIGVNADQSDLSPRVITSAVKDIEGSVNGALSAAARNHFQWPGIYEGACKMMGVMEDAVGLSMENSRFRQFSPEMYEVIYAAITNASVSVNNSTDSRFHPQAGHITVDWLS